MNTSVQSGVPTTAQATPKQITTNQIDYFQGCTFSNCQIQAGFGGGGGLTVNNSAMDTNSSIAVGRIDVSEFWNVAYNHQNVSVIDPTYGYYDRSFDVATASTSDPSGTITWNFVPYSNASYMIDLEQPLNDVHYYGLTMIVKNTGSVSATIVSDALEWPPTGYAFTLKITALPT